MSCSRGECDYSIREKFTSAQFQDGDDRDEEDGAPSQSPDGLPHDSHVTVTTHPPSPAKVEQTPPVSPVADTKKLQAQILSLQQALVESEQQTQLINIEYKKLLAEKEVCECVLCLD